MQLYISNLLSRLIAFTVCIGISSMLLGHEFELDAELAMDESIRTGVLDNGLRYYIKSNNEPENRVSMRLVVNAGSLQEEHDQRGLAHFIEHMAFNGTKRFRKSEVINFLEGVGMRFGSHVNAYTSFNETVYKLELPADSERVLERGFDILRDWAGEIAFDVEEIEKERGVIVEEWRSRRGAQQRIRDNQYPILFYNSDYAKRLPIGSTFVIRNAPRHRFVDFYQDWYRPDLMAVVVVGSIDVDRVEQSIVDRFSNMTNPEESKPRVSYDIPDHEQTLFSIQEDPEITTSSMALLQKVPKIPDGTARDYKASILRRLYFGMLNKRLGERTLEARPPFMGANVSFSPLGREKSAFYYSIQFLENNYQEGVSALIGELNRAKRDGFSETELERMKNDMLRAVERIYEERENTHSGDLAAEYIRNFLQGEPVPGIAVELEMTRQFLGEIGMKEIRAFGDKLPLEEQNRVVLFTAPQRDGYILPKEAEVREMLSVAQNSVLEEYDDSVSSRPLLDPLPEGGAIESEKYHESVDIHEWNLSNGVRVLLKQTDFKNDQILMNAFSPGGHSQVLDDEYLAAAVSTMVLGESGLGEFSVVDLDKKLSGKVVQVSPYINSQSEGLRGATSPKDLETFFQLLYLQMTAPRLDEDAYASLLIRLEGVLANRSKSPQVVFQDRIMEELYENHPRREPLTSDMLRLFDPELSLAVYEDRFSDASDFTFVFVGAMDLKSFKPYVSKYLGGLPAVGREEEGRLVDGTLREGVTSFSMNKGLEDKSVVRVQYFGEAEWSVDNRYSLIAARDVLDIRLRNVLREEKGGTYGVSLSANLSRAPEERFSSGFAFSCDPENVQIMIMLAQAEIDRLKREGPSESDLSKVKEIHLRGVESGLQSNNFWLQSISTIIQEERDLDEILKSEERIKGLKADSVKKAFEVYFDRTNMLEAILNPQVNPDS
ncbi:insulinase family protein [Puniceicoccaceae bacterium K14]|nr:insulinase family protein [Puniceicoccaceae bacterium K14]